MKELVWFFVADLCIQWAKVLKPSLLYLFRFSSSGSDMCRGSECRSSAPTQPSPLPRASSRCSRRLWGTRWGLKGSQARINGQFSGELWVLQRRQRGRQACSYRDQRQRCWPKCHEWWVEAASRNTIHVCYSKVMQVCLCKLSKMQRKRLSLLVWRHEFNFSIRGVIIHVLTVVWFNSVMNKI